MFDRLLDDMKLATGRAARQTFLVGAAAVSLFIATSFLCAAAFISVLQRYGIVYACLTGAAIFFIVTLVAAGSYAAQKGLAKKRIVEDAKPVASSFMPDPMVLATGLEVVKAIGFKRLIPILAVAGVALGYLATRGETEPDQSADE